MRLTAAGKHREVCELACHVNSVHSEHTVWAWAKPPPPVYPTCWCPNATQTRVLSYVLLGRVAPSDPQGWGRMLVQFFKGEIEA